MKGVFVIAYLLVISTAYGQEKLTLDEIYNKKTFTIKSMEGLRWMNDGKHYTSLVRNNGNNYNDILKYSVETGQVVDTILSGADLVPEEAAEPLAEYSYEFNQDESMLLLATQSEKIYRRSSKAINYVYKLSSRDLALLDEGGKQSYATISPDGDKVAFVRDNNIFYRDLSANSLVQVTTDGKKNEIINGFADWVYEEELYQSKVFYWSSDGSKIAFLRFDETQVPEYNMQKWGDLYPEDYTFKYPKAGEPNSKVTAHVYDLESGNTVTVQIDDEKEYYLARMQWLPNGSVVSITRLNRLQNKMEVFHYDVELDKVKLVYSETANTYIGINQVDDLYYLKKSDAFIISSEKSGFKHLYHYDLDGNLLNAITTGEWEVTDFKGYDEKSKKLFYESTEVSSLERHLYTVGIDGKSKKQLSSQPGTHSTSFGPNFKFYIDTYSSVNTPKTISLHNAKGKELKVLVENSDYLANANKFGFAKTEFFFLPLGNGDSLNAYMMKPNDFDSGKKYPVLMFVYGGPGSQNVSNSWNSRDWHHLLTQEGYIVVCIDNRGTGGKGRDFKHITYENLGKYESEDQIKGAKYLAGLDYIDAERIGIWGWSYGGYMSSLCMMLGNEFFKAAISIAPVTNWRYYDTIYTERYLKRPQDNEAGYDDYSPVSHVDKLDGSFLLIHGTGDDNVHFQNSVALQDALIKANKQFDSFYYPNRNHGISGGNTRLHLYTLMTNFIKENL